MDKEDQQIRTEPMDLDNTVLKMACKRALIHATRTGTAASDVFAQDLEDLPEHLRAVAQEEPPIQQPQATGPPPAAAQQPPPQQAADAPQAALPEQAAQPPAEQPAAATKPPAQDNGQEPPPPTEADAPAAEPAPEPQPQQYRTIGVVERMSAKSGGSADRPWTRYAAKVNGEWHSTFDKGMGTVIQDLKNSGEVAVLIYHMDGDYRNLDNAYREMDEVQGSDDVPFD
jgi:cytoskeletal protein RodZ